MAGGTSCRALKLGTIGVVQVAELCRLQFSDARDYVCYVISGVVKISVALVLYRLEIRLSVRIVLIADMVICAVWTVVVTLILGLGCTTFSPYELNDSVCEASDYAQESSYVIFNTLHVLIPVFMLWGVQVNGNLKWAVIALFGVGMLYVLLPLLITILRPGRDP